MNKSCLYQIKRVIKPGADVRLLSNLKVIKNVSYSDDPLKAPPANPPVVSIEFSPLCTIELTKNWYQLHNGEHC